MDNSVSCLSFFINFVSFFHLIILFPAFCIAAARLIFDLLSRVKNQKNVKRVTIAVISVLGLFGLVSTTLLITTNVTSNYFQVYSFIVQYLINHEGEDNIKHRDDNTNTKIDYEEVTFMGRHWTRGFLWIPIYVYDRNLDFRGISEVQDIPLPKTMDRFLIIMDPALRRSLSETLSELDVPRPYYLSRAIATFFLPDTYVYHDTSKYPYSSMSQNRDTKWVQIREYNVSNSSGLFLK